MDSDYIHFIYDLLDNNFVDSFFCLKFCNSNYHKGYSYNLICSIYSNDFNSHN